MDAALVADDVRRTYGDTVALDGVSLSVDEGEVFGLIGPNGAGKTTLVRALTGTTDAEGTVRVLGEEPTKVDTQRVGLLPQSFTPPERLTARELVDYYAGLYEEARDSDGVLADVGLGDAGDTWYENLSGGQQRRVCVATALVNDPDVLFLDEPTTGIDPAGRRALWALLEDLADTGTTVFLTSHSMDEVERLADRVGLLNDGRLVAVGSPGDLVAEHGGETRLVVRTDAGTDALVDAGFVVEADAETLTFHDVDPRDIGRAVEALERAGVDYDSLTWKQPGLEEVYLRLTGETFEGMRPAETPAATPEASR
ncbi:ABC-2 type transport system ATP-binding protein [Halogranum amylolyticum]|uniref:ABC-2 type transport system ATP-binding protein n=1 Tax=Halogranum amylolyticum TaxID=660520 RepID=A0A1H8TZP8_9EURY|nr:ABC transporter ATP-binding protein [Halogranum amylolyticum]SEO96479.1 ABC-2 type transport system ATP-binding protein [Halogranum amylolyticum]